MNARRLTALLLAVFMLHLNFLGADLACSKHGDESARPGATTHEMHGAQPAQTASHDHGSHAVPDQPSLQNASNDAPCEIPAQSNCCQALMGCSIVFSANAEVTTAASLAPRVQVIANALRAPVSEVPAPEPPPPRA